MISAVEASVDESLATARPQSIRIESGTGRTESGTEPVRLSDVSQPKVIGPAPDLRFNNGRHGRPLPSQDSSRQVHQDAATARRAPSSSRSIACCDEGYSLAAIRAALADAGMRVSKSTVHREAVRRRPVRSALPSLTTPVHDQVAAAARADVNGSATRRSDDARSGRDIARAFFEGRITNPLLLARGLR